jgi:hypothetical protein
MHLKHFVEKNNKNKRDRITNDEVFQRAREKKITFKNLKK